jgi:hypothetical protein
MIRILPLAGLVNQDSTSALIRIPCDGYPLSVCFDSAAVAATLSTSGTIPFTLSVAERSRRVSHWIVIIKKPYKRRRPGGASPRPVRFGENRAVSFYPKRVTPLAAKKER